MPKLVLKLILKIWVLFKIKQFTKLTQYVTNCGINQVERHGLL